ncbi:MAG: DHHA1 domain-containing protein [Candidatus Nanoarchaeia archaeon]|nr:DHHA1 domain-containing protein [Candidatus Nanoarchaeia archaeon]MDD5358019.1 DHHA1 domain-containing protein [Candidatus Nanoarchaeia archaeon]MDD5588938.1 DHHA1 domain-containing protein [Candidatus Nanoarchaeia archaeon]
MLTKKQISEIREHLEKAQNPIFFFDNDNDGLCSFLILRRYLGRGKGIAVKSFPDMNAEYFRRVNELNADYIFILDKPVVNEEFFEEAKKFNIPVVWIDHHEVQVKIPNFIYYYNSAFHGKKNEPVTYLCYKIADKKEDLWLGVVGCISDRFFPDFYKDFVKLYPDLSVKSKDAFTVFYKSQIGNIAKIFSFALKDTTSNVMKLIYFLVGVKTPYEVLEETNKNKGMHYRFKQVYRKYEKLVEKAKSIADDDKILFFQYGGEMSISADLSNELTYLYPKKIIIVIKVAGMKANLSLRGIKIREPFLKAIKNIEGATGGGHENAVGGQMRIEDIEKFRENFEREINS